MAEFKIPLAFLFDTHTLPTTTNVPISENNFFRQMLYVTMNGSLFDGNCTLENFEVFDRVYNESGRLFIWEHTSGTTKNT